MTPSLSFQIAIETATRCGGACAGCALDDQERNKQMPVNGEHLVLQLTQARRYIEEEVSRNNAEVEAITLFFGQGDHFLLSADELLQLIQAVNDVWSPIWSDKTVCLMTASAVTKQESLKEKATLFKRRAETNKCQWFVQVVFDPKKITATPAFAKTYLENILFLKETFEMVELTINLAADITRHMTPLELHEWVKHHQIKHVEFNWVVRPEMTSMWQLEMDEVWEWLKEFVRVSWSDKTYEINFMPWMTKKLKRMEESVDLHERALYITQEGLAITSQVGPIANVMPLQDRKEIKPWGKRKALVEVQKAFLKEPCHSCHYRHVCEQNGVYVWTKWMPKTKMVGCPWSFDIWYDELKELTKDSQGDTVFDKNPHNNKREKPVEGQANTTYFLSKEVGV